MAPIVEPSLLPREPPLVRASGLDFRRICGLPRLAAEGHLSGSPTRDWIGGHPHPADLDHDSPRGALHFSASRLVRAGGRGDGVGSLTAAGSTAPGPGPTIAVPVGCVDSRRFLPAAVRRSPLLPLHQPVLSYAAGLAERCRVCSAAD